MLAEMCELTQGAKTSALTQIFLLAHQFVLSDKWSPF
jgi:hypothetical protein